MFKKYLLPFCAICFAAMLITLLGFALIVDAGEKYKCLAELYPKVTEENGIQKIGEYYTSEKGNTFRVLAECKKIGEDVWLQFIDTDMDEFGKLDNRVDYIMQLYLEDGKLWMGNIFTYDDFAGIGTYLMEYCKEHNIKIEDFLHIAPDVLEKTMPGVEA